MKVRSRFSARLLSPANLVFIGVSIFCIRLAAGDLATTAEHANLTYIYNNLQQDDARSGDVVARYSADVERIISNGDCRSDVVNAGLGIALLDLDRQNSVADYDAWAASVARAERYVKYALGCNPGDGNLWARLAMISWATGESPAQLSALMKQSVSRNPSEIGVLRARFVVWQRANAETLRLASGALNRDLETVLNFGDHRAIEDMLSRAGVDLRPYVQMAVSKLSQGRLDSLGDGTVDRIMS